jgi:hypothetical protein
MVQLTRARLAILIASLFILVLLGVSSYSILRLWRAPIWNPLKLAQAHAAIESMPSVLGSLKAKFRSTESLGECGGFFNMDEGVARRIEREGLRFFDNATRGRAYGESDPTTSRYSYAAWQATPIPSVWNQDGSFALGFRCMHAKRETVDAIFRNSPASSSCSASGSASTARMASASISSCTVFLLSPTMVAFRAD